MSCSNSPHSISSKRASEIILATSSHWGTTGISSASPTTVRRRLDYSDRSVEEDGRKITSTTLLDVSPIVEHIEDVEQEASPWRESPPSPDFNQAVFRSFSDPGSPDNEIEMMTTPLSPRLMQSEFVDSRPEESSFGWTPPSPELETPVVGFGKPLTFDILGEDDQQASDQSSSFNPVSCMDKGKARALEKDDSVIDETSSEAEEMVDAEMALALEISKRESQYRSSDMRYQIEEGSSSTSDPGGRLAEVRETSNKLKRMTDGPPRSASDTIPMG